jgi:CDGSH-type Zn-finger protein
MGREVRHDATEPAILDADDLGDDGKLYVCRCGLSETKPLCDGSHRRTRDEAADTVYRYDPDDVASDRCEVEAVVLADE